VVKKGLKGATKSVILGAKDPESFSGKRPTKTGGVDKVMPEPPGASKIKFSGKPGRSPKPFALIPRKGS